MEDWKQIKDLKIVEIVNSYPTSVRLKNSINKAQNANKLPFETVGDYWEQGSKASDNLLDLLRSIESSR